MSVVSSHCVDDWLQLADRKFSYGATYRVVTDSRNDAALEVLLGAVSATPHPVPAHFASYSLFGSSDSSAFAQTYDVKRIKDGEEGKLGKYWLVTVGWALPDKADDDATSQEDPLSRPVRYNVEREEMQVIVEEGWNEEELPALGRAEETLGPIVNAAGGEPGTPLTKTIRVPVLVARKNFATLEEVVAIQQAYEDKLNDGDFFGAPEKTALVREVTISDELFGGGIEYREATFRIAIFHDGWSIPLVNRGYRHWKILDGDEEPTLIEAKVWDEVEGREVPSAEPVNLELDGFKTPDGEIGTVINYRVHDTASFAGMGIGG